MPTQTEAKPIYRTFRAEIKGVDAQSGLINMVIPMSTGAVDRDEEIIDPTAFKRTVKEFMKRPILLSSHMYGDLRKNIGQFRKLDVTDQGLMADGLEYYVGRGNDEADWGFFLASKGMAAFSVGFIPKKWEPIDPDKEEGFFGGNRRFTEVELLEISQVVVPSNREAIQGVRGKSIDDPVATALLDEVDKGLEDGTVTKPEETDQYYRIPVKDEEGKHDGHRIRTITVSDEKGIKALYCGECKVITTYLFDKDDKYGWTMESAQEWVNDHAKDYELVEVPAVGDEEPQFAIRCILPGFEETKAYTCECIKCGHTLETEKHCADIKCPKCGGEMRRAERPGPGKSITQGQLADDLDYALGAIKEVGLNEENMPAALALADEIIQRSTGSDIPDNILAKVGAVLNAKNKGKLKQAQTLIQEVLDSATAEDDGDKQVPLLPAAPSPEEQKAQRAKDVAEVASLVVAQLKGKRIR